MLKRILVFFILSVFILSSLQSVTAVEKNYVFSGRGYGHGVGMSQHGARGLAAKGWSYKRILAHFYKNTKLKRVNSKTLRVLIATNRGSISFTAAKTFSLYDERSRRKYHLRARNRYKIFLAGGRLRITDKTRNKSMGTFYSNVRVSNGGGVQLLSADDNGIKNNKYRGKIRFVKRGRRISAVNYLNSEHYLYSVVRREMPTSWSMEALKTQAVAARTYALKSLKKGTYFDLYTTVKSQMYTGLRAENVRSVQAVTRTSKEVITYRGKMIKAYYFSSSGGKTENNENVWGSNPISWLRSVSSPYEGKAAFWPSSKRFSAGYLSKKLGKYSSKKRYGVKGSLRGLEVVKRSASPRVLKVKISGSRGNSYISGSRLRSILRLRSTWYYINGKNSIKPSNPAKKKSALLMGSVKTDNNKYLNALPNTYASSNLYFDYFGKNDSLLIRNTGHRKSTNVKISLLNKRILGRSQVSLNPFEIKAINKKWARNGYQQITSSGEKLFAVRQDKKGFKYQAKNPNQAASSNFVTYFEPRKDLLYLTNPNNKAIRAYVYLMNDGRTLKRKNVRIGKNSVASLRFRNMRGRKTAFIRVNSKGGRIFVSKKTASKYFVASQPASKVRKNLILQNFVPKRDVLFITNPSRKTARLTLKYIQNGKSYYSRRIKIRAKDVIKVDNRRRLRKVGEVFLKINSNRPIIASKRMAGNTYQLAEPTSFLSKISYIASYNPSGEVIYVTNPTNYNQNARVRVYVGGKLVYSKQHFVANNKHIRIDLRRSDISKYSNAYVQILASS